MSYRHPIILRQRFAPVRHQPSYNSYDYDESDENHPPTFQNNDRPESATSSFPPRKSFIDTIVTRNDEYWQNRVTLKLDVPFTDHSHIIGRGGKNTQAVMKQTACHIHFPDSNKNHDSDKSNQVSIAGPIGKVEIARSRIRGLAPLSISFELKGMLPTVNVDQLVADACLEKTLGFAELNIVVRTNRASGQPYCLVRGSAHQMDMMIEACEALRRLFFPPETAVSYSTSLEVLPAQQASVIGRNGRHIDWIAQKTGATVHFPSASDCQRGASTFYIAGSINAILDARKHILGLLPVQLTFEVRKGNAKATQPDPAVIEQLLGVALSVKYRPNGGDQGAKAVTVRSCEYNLTNVYAVRSHLVDSTDDVVLCADYDFMRDMRAVIEQSIGQPPSPNHTDPAACFPPMQSLAQPHLATPHPLLFSGFSQYLLQQNGCNMPLHQLTTAPYMQQRQMGLPSAPSLLLSAQQQQQQQYAQSPQYPIQPQLYANSLMQQHASLPLKQWLMSDRSDCASMELDGSAWAERSTPPETSSSPPPPSSIADRPESTTTTSMKTAGALTGGSKPSEPPTTPKTSAISPNPDESPLAHSVLAAAKKYSSAQNGSLWKAPGFERRPLTSDLDRLRILATQAMHESPTHGGVRTPTEQWSGMLFSNSAPTAALKTKSMFDQPPLRARFRVSNDDESGTGDTSTVGTLPSVLEDGDGEDNDAPGSAFVAVPPRSTNFTTTTGRRPTEFAATSYWDSASLQSPYMNIDWDIRKFRDPSMVLAALGLSDHHGRFRDEEIDMDAFLSLDEENLKELGVSTIGARTKLRIAIMKLNESNAMYGQQ